MYIVQYSSEDDIQSINWSSYIFFKTFFLDINVRVCVAIVFLQFSSRDNFVAVHSGQYTQINDVRYTIHIDTDV